MPSLRTLLILGRASNLPTVWSNCLAGWWLACAGVNGVTGWSVWCGLALAFYIVGLSFLARKETRGEVNLWPIAFLAVPILLAWLMNQHAYQKDAWLLSALLVLWSARSLRFAFRASERNIGRAISGLLAGIVLVDLLAVVDVTHGLAMVFIALLLLALLFQRFVPAT